MLRNIGILLFFMLCTQFLFAQHKILLTHKEQNKENAIKKGFDIIYKLEGGEVKTAKIKDITAEHICTKTDTFGLAEIVFIGYEKSNTEMLKMGATLSFYGSFLNLLVAYFIYTRAPGFSTVGNFFAFMGIVPMVISKQILDLNDFILFDLSYQWDAVIVEY